MTTTPKRVHLWPVMITLWMICFISACVFFVIKSLGVNHDLVVKDYYGKSLEHDEVLAARARTRKLEVPPRIRIEADEARMVVTLPDTARDAVLSLYRPSDASLDVDVALQDVVPSVLPLAPLHPGMWEAHIHWEENGNSYLFEQDLYIP